ncbi:MAG TPA: DUF4198 domain-containing protein [Bryobacteraceae bacterium]|nr:DUF4198 domain-containing protein [Bryobacteraceae bacterium]
MHISRFRLIPALALFAGLAPSLLAHRQWMLPSSTVLSAADPWVTVDAAVSNELFYFDHVPLRLNNLTITAPDGSAIEPQNPATGKYRSTFDINLKKQGTYRVSLVNSTVFATWTENGEAKNWRGTAAAFAKEVPQNATGLKTSKMNSRVELFLTSGKPTREALAPTGSGLEMVPVTHPNDLVAGEAATFQLLSDGKPAADLEVTVIPGGIRYRNQLHEVKIKTDAEGKFTTTFKDPGMYWLNASTGGGRGPGGPGGPVGGPNAGAPRQGGPNAGGPRPGGGPGGGPGGRMPAGNRASYVATLEVLPQ